MVPIAWGDFANKASARFRSFSAIAVVVAVVFGAFGAQVIAQTAPELGTTAAIPTNLAGTVAYANPPSGFDPITASDAALAQYGFPPRPDSQGAPQAYSLWQKLVSTPQTRITNPDLQPTKTYHHPAMDLSSEGKILANGAASYTASNWSGYAIVANNGTFNVNDAAVYGEYVMPIAQQAFGVCSGSWDYSAQWIGFDGFQSNDVLQAGTEANAYCSDGVRTASYLALYEWFPSGPVAISNLTIKPGDVMGLEVWYTTASPSGHLYMLNYTTQKSVTIGFNPPVGTTLAGNSVEWIVERPSLGSTYTSLTNYVATPFNKTYALSDGTCYYPGSSPVGTIYSITMQSGGIPISVANLYGNYTLWFYDEGPAY